MQTETQTLCPLAGPPVIHQILSIRGGEQNLPESLDGLYERLEIVLDRHKESTGELSRNLFCWGVNTVTLLDNEQSIEGLSEIALERLGILDKLLITSEIDRKALEANLPLDLKVNDFALETLAWFKEAQDLLGYKSSLEIVASLQKVNLSALPVSIATQMYHNLRSNQEKIEQATEELSLIKNTRIKATPGLVALRQSLRNEVREAKEKLENKLLELKELCALKMDVMEERHRIEIETSNFQLTNFIGDQDRLRTQLISAEHNNRLNAERALELSIEIDQQKHNIAHLENELHSSSSGGCAIS